MDRLKKILADAVLVVQILILFIVVFENRIEVPALLQAFGRMHPLLLHLPIGLLLVTFILIFTRRYFHGTALDELVSLLLHFTAITASFTTLMGLLLSLEGTFGADQLWLHKWLGIALSFLCWGLLMLKDNFKLLKPLGSAGVVLLILTGHYGANLTHGEDFVWAPLQSDPPRAARIITDSTALFTATIEPILESKCYGCHNSKKAKGNLVLTSLETIRKGGKNGALWKAQDPASSLLVERLLLPLDHDEHMPPKDKAQLTDDELAFISLWISHGADTKKKLGELAEDDTLARLASVIIPRYQQPHGLEPQYTFRFASPEKIEKLSIPNRTVFQIAKNEPAVQADFYLRESYDRKYLEELLDVKEQLISLNLSKMPVEDEELETIAKFQNLESLNLNNTAIKGTGLKALSSLPKLRALSLSGTEVSAAALRELDKSSSLEEVFIWNTRVSEDEVTSLTKDFPHIKWNIGYVPNEDEILKLNPPILKSKGLVLGREEKLVLRHNLPGTEVRYTLDGSDPDSVRSPLYQDPLEIANFAAIKARAFKEGWLSSDVAELFVFRQGLRPDSVALLTKPDDSFAGEGAQTLVDGQNGLADYYRHPAWLGFRENDLALTFSFVKETPTVSNISLSYAHNSYTICLPPDEMQLWGGNNPDDLKLIAQKKFPGGKRPRKARIEGVTMDVPASQFKYYKLVAVPTRKLPNGNPKKRKLWLMVDEVLIN